MSEIIEVREHSRLSCSASERWIHCPASVQLSEKAPPQKESAYALEGTEAHAIAEKCLREWTDAPESEMGEAVQVYLDFVRSLITKEELESKKKFMFIEQRFNLDWIHKDCFGSNDCSIFDPDARTLWVIDYKHGQGISVSPEWNSQLMMYALGAQAKVWFDFVERNKYAPRTWEFIETVKLVIVQPRARDNYGDDEKAIRVFEMSAKDLQYWALNILKPATVMVDSENPPIRVGEHCRFCRAIAICPAQVEHAMAVAKTDFKTLPSPEALTPSEVKRVLDFSGMFDVWLSEVKALAQSKAESGYKIEGYKLVQRKANRKWKSEDVAAQTLGLVLGEEAFEKSLISIAKAEKALKKIKQDSILEGLWEKPPTGVTLVPESDPRKEVLPSVSIFLDDADFLQ